MPKNILLVVGSLREKSFNKVVATYVAEELAKHGHSTTFLDYSKLPLLNQDIEFPTPTEVSEVRQEVEAADAVWFFTPEYNSAIPGSLKNLLDWLSRHKTSDAVYGQPTIIHDKKATVSSAAGHSKGVHAKKQVLDIIKMIKMDVLPGEGSAIELPREAFQTGEFELTADQKTELSQHVQQFIQFLG